jgi:hypothetical protein
MEKNTFTKFKWFWAWQDEAEEAWLGEMSKKGYHLVSTGVPTLYTFAPGEPRDYIYRLDFHTFSKRDKQEYLQLFSDAGWEHLGEMSAWQYFRKEARPGEADEIFTDNESKRAKYKRVLAFLCLFFPVLTFVFWGRLAGDYPIPWWGAIQVIILLVMALFTYAIIRLVIRIKQLKKL